MDTQNPSGPPVGAVRRVDGVTAVRAEPPQPELTKGLTPAPSRRAFRQASTARRLPRQNDVNIELDQHLGHRET